MTAVAGGLKGARIFLRLVNNGDQPWTLKGYACEASRGDRPAMDRWMSLSVAPSLPGSQIDQLLQPSFGKRIPRTPRALAQPVELATIKTACPRPLHGHPPPATHARSMFEGSELRVVTTSYFVGAKIDGFKGSGRGDFQASKDLEDIITVIDGRPTVLEEVREWADDVRTAIAGELAPSSPTDSFFSIPSGPRSTRRDQGEDSAHLGNVEIASRVEGQKAPSDASHGQSAAEPQMPMNEADTCRKYVAPKLLDAGWDSDPHSIAEQRSFTDGRIVVVGEHAHRRPRKRVDYLLRYTRDLPLAGVDIMD